MSHLHQVRAEIKSWEREFAARHGRDPSLEDIRDQPLVLDKYKLYKKLAKASTPPRLPLPKSRPDDALPPLPGFNPFSPTKRTPPKQNTRQPTLPQPTANASAAPTTAVSRARKRLRGDPVSPSPNKPKRLRITSQPEHDSSSSGHDSDRELPHCHFASPFVADSPVKAPAGGKSFKVLFDDVLPALAIPKKPLGGHPDPPFLQNASADPSSLWLHQDSTSAHKHRTNPVQHKPNLKAAPSEGPQPPPSAKRTLDSVDLVSKQTESTLLHSRHPLIPPSPPPQESANRGNPKGKAKATTGRKKPKIDDEESDEEPDSPVDVTLKIATVRLDRAKHLHGHVDDLGWDSLPHLGTHNHDPATSETNHASTTFSVDLPDKIRCMLAISPSRSQSGMQERVVRGLLYGDRVGHYDPSRGGDIWGAGETNEDTHEDADTEDDWEGEPVPWEAGEL